MLDVGICLEGLLSIFILTLSLYLSRFFYIFLRYYFPSSILPWLSAWFVKLAVRRTKAIRKRQTFWVVNQQNNHIQNKKRKICKRPTATWKIQKRWPAYRSLFSPKQHRYKSLSNHSAYMYSYLKISKLKSLDSWTARASDEWVLRSLTRSRPRSLRTLNTIRCLLSWHILIIVATLRDPSFDVSSRCQPSTYFWAVLEAFRLEKRIDLAGGCGPLILTPHISSSVHQTRTIFWTCTKRLVNKTAENSPTLYSRFPLAFSPFLSNVNVRDFSYFSCLRTAFFHFFD